MAFSLKKNTLVVASMVVKIAITCSFSYQQGNANKKTSNP